MNILESINSPQDLKNLEKEKIPQLCSEIRGFLVQSISQSGGHLASNLGIVELTVAIHRVYDTEKDRLVFDVGHQSYVHKILTGRREQFPTLRSLDGLSGFPKPTESIHDAFVAGHASNSVSVALGMARARTSAGGDYDVLALIGDGALTGGLSYEGISDLGGTNEPMVVILNDNGMSINGNVGGVASFLAGKRSKAGYLSFKESYRRIVGKIPPLYNFLHRCKERLKKILLPSTMFDDMGLYYLGPVDGNDEASIETALRWAKELNEPVLLHVITQKGRGCEFAEGNPGLYHGVGAYNPATGEMKKGHGDFSACFGHELKNLADKDESIFAITAAMCDGTGLREFSRSHKDRFIDAGIAEGHAVSMAAGLAKQGMKPVFAVYSTFLQRGYDMLIHDISLLNLNVVLAVDRGGLVGNDGETHQGVFDISYLSSIPHMTVLCPSNYAELKSMLHKGLYDIDGSAAIRYPRGAEGDFTEDTSGEMTVKLIPGDEITLVSYGIMINEVIAAARSLEKKGFPTPEVIKLNSIKPLDTDIILESAGRTKRLVVIEDAASSGCVGEKILSQAAQKGVILEEARLLNLGEGIVPHGNTQSLYEREGIGRLSIEKTCIEMLGELGVVAIEENTAGSAGV